jgi:hypothetical protein
LREPFSFRTGDSIAGRTSENFAKIKKIELLDDSKVTSEVSRKGRAILQKLQFDDIVPTP